MTPDPSLPMTYAAISGMPSPLSRLIMGTMALSADDLPFSFALLDHFVSLGGTTLDTAHVYRDGGAERAVGAWLGARGNRDRIVLIGKGAHHDAQGPRVTPAAIRADLRESLERLRTPFIDLYLLHRDDPTQPVGPIMECLHAERQAGRIHAYGASNWRHQRIEEANAFAAAHGLAGFVASSPNLALAVQNEAPWPGTVSAVDEERDWYRRTRFPLLAWSSQAQGFFANPDNAVDPALARVWHSAANVERRRRARTLAARKGTQAHAIALAYVLCQPFPTCALIGPRAPSETSESIAALEIVLSPHELAWLNLERETPDD